MVDEFANRFERTIVDAKRIGALLQLLDSDVDEAFDGSVGRVQLVSEQFGQGNQ